MSKQLRGFLIGIFGLAIVFVLTVLVMGSVNGRNFVDEIKSWGDSMQEEVVDPGDNTLTEGENSDNEVEDNVENETQTTAVITIMSNNDFKIAL